MCSDNDRGKTDTSTEGANYGGLVSKGRLGTCLICRCSLGPCLWGNEAEAVQAAGGCGSCPHASMIITPAHTPLYHPCCCLIPPLHCLGGPVHCPVDRRHQSLPPLKGPLPRSSNSASHPLDPAQRLGVFSTPWGHLFNSLLSLPRFLPKGGCLFLPTPPYLLYLSFHFICSP